jgi:hypothetical protein
MKFNGRKIMFVMAVTGFYALASVDLEDFFYVFTIYIIGKSMLWGQGQF